MLIAFILTMPNCGSWNGKWTGEGILYARVKSFTVKDKEKTNAILERGGYYYRWDDGWGANVSVKKINGKEATKIRKNTKGFCGYDWMIGSIIRHGEILID